MAIIQSFVSANKSQQDLKVFDSGKAQLDQFLARFACRDMGLGISTTWVLPTDEKSENGKNKVAAYYTLASQSVRRKEIPVDKLPPYQMPVVLLAKLAVDQSYQGNGLGGKVLVEALRHAVALTNKGLPAVGLILDVLDDEALNFYSHFEIFEPVTDDPMRLFVPMQTLRNI